MPPKPKLSPNECDAIRVWAALGRSVPEVARNLNVSPSAVRRAIRGEFKTRGYRNANV